MNKDDLLNDLADYSLKILKNILMREKIKYLMKLYHNSITFHILQS
jgi:hypothetical protein